MERLRNSEETPTIKNSAAIALTAVCTMPCLAMIRVSTCLDGREVSIWLCFYAIGAGQPNIALRVKRQFDFACTMHYPGPRGKRYNTTAYCALCFFCFLRCINSSYFPVSLFSVQYRSTYLSSANKIRLYGNLKWIYVLRAAWDHGSKVYFESGRNLDVLACERTERLLLLLLLVIGGIEARPQYLQ